MAQERECIYCHKKYLVSKNSRSEVYTCARCEKKWREFEEEYFLGEKPVVEKQKAY